MTQQKMRLPAGEPSDADDPVAGSDRSDRSGRVECNVAFITEPRIVRKIIDHLNANANRERAPPTPSI